MDLAKLLSLLDRSESLPEGWDPARPSPKEGYGEAVPEDGTAFILSE